MNGLEDRHKRKTVRLATIATMFAAVVLLAALWRGHEIWRAAYHYLPRRIQAAPYMIEARLSEETDAPEQLPTPESASPLTDLESLGLTGGRSPGGGYADSSDLREVGTPTPGSRQVPTAPVNRTATASALRQEHQSATAVIAPNAGKAPTTVPRTAQLEGVRHEYQTWNNCGPATVSMALSYYGESGTQADAARQLKPDPDDKNVGPYELATYASQRGYHAPVLVNGDVERLKALLAVGTPVIVETWFVPEPGDEMGHYRVLAGYSDDEKRFITYDSYNGPRVSLGYEELDRLWRVFNRTYVPVYDAARATAVQQIIGPDMDANAMYASAVGRALEEVARSQDAYGWFNLGSSLLAMGDAAGAAEAFDRARQIGLPWRMLWYQHGPFEAYAAIGRWSDVLDLAAANLRNADNLEESHYWRGRALAAGGDLEAARESYERCLELNPHYTRAAEALAEGTSSLN